MKKLLLSTTLLASFIAAPAFADAGEGQMGGIDVTVGGAIDFQTAFSDQDAVFQGNSRDFVFSNDTEIHVKAEGQADNGLKYGAVIELEADVTSSNDNEGENADKTYIFLESQLGRTELGNNAGAEKQLKVDASTIARATGGVDGDFYYYIDTNGATNTASFLLGPDLPSQDAAGIQEDATKVSYFTPRFSGFQAGLSFTPDTGNGGSTTGLTADNNGDFENVFSPGINYTNEYNGVGVMASLTAEIGESELATQEDLEAYAAGLGFSYQGFSVAGSYGDWQESGFANGSSDEADVWTIGAAYETGPFGVSVGYLSSERADDEFSNIVVGADYQLAPGLVPYAEIAFYDLDEAGTTVDNEEYVVLVGTNLSF